MKKIASKLDDLLDICSGWEKESGSKHRFLIPPPQIVIENGKKVFKPLTYELEGRKTLARIAYSVSGNGDNRAEVATWRRIFEGLDQYPHMIEFYGGKLPSEVFREKVDGFPAIKKQRGEPPVIKEKTKNTIQNYSILPLWTTKYQPYIEEYKTFIEKEKELGLAIDKQKEYIFQAKHKGASPQINEQKLTELEREKQNLFDAKKAYIENISKDIVAVEDNIIKILSMQSKDRKIQFSVIQDSMMQDFFDILSLLISDKKLTYNHEKNLEAYNDIIEWLGLESDDSTKINLSATIYQLFKQGKLNINEEGTFVSINGEGSSSRLAKRLRILFFTKIGK
jgi:hypothetical protein